MNIATQFKRLNAAATWRAYAAETNNDALRKRYIYLATWNIWDSARLRKLYGVRKFTLAAAE